MFIVRWTFKTQNKTHLATDSVGRSLRMIQQTCQTFYRKKTNDYNAFSCPRDYTEKAEFQFFSVEFLLF